MRSNLRALRAGRGWTQAELSVAAEVSRYTINALETERHEPSLDLAQRLAAIFGVTVDAIFPNPYAWV